MASKENQKFVDEMLRSAEEKKEVKPYKSTDDVSEADIERITGNIRESIQKGKR